MKGDMFLIKEDNYPFHEGKSERLLILLDNGITFGFEKIYSKRGIEEKVYSIGWTECNFGELLRYDNDNGRK